MFPDFFADFMAPIAHLKGQDVLVAYAQLLQSEHLEVQLPAAQAWSLWESRVATLLPNAAMRSGAIDEHSALPLARIENHYFLHHCFLAPQQLLNDLPKVQHLPCWIVHGRYDVVCKLENAWSLHQAWPGSKLQIIDNAGHSASEPGICRALFNAATEFAEHFNR